MILKAIQGVSFPPNPALVVDALHTCRRVMKQASSVWEVYKLQGKLGKAVKQMSTFALKLVDAVARTAELLKHADMGGCCPCCR